MSGWTRRRALQSALAGIGTAFLPYAEIFAEPSASTRLLRAPKHALVIGNARYQHSPLKNSINDANGMAATLDKVGFSVTLGTDLTQSAMRDAIRAFGETLSQQAHQKDERQAPHANPPPFFSRHLPLLRPARPGIPPDRFII